MSRKRKNKKHKKQAQDCPRIREWRWYKQLLHDGISPDGLPIKPFPPGPSLGIMKCGKYPQGKERFLAEKPGWYEWYEWYECLRDPKTGKIIERRGWYRLTKR